ncbi:MAG: alpha/beta hydrolase-fold protein [Candidatus Binatia bacterium]
MRDMRTRVVAVLDVLLLLAGARLASAALPGSLPSVTSGARPGPDVLYAPAPVAPQLENRDARFTAAPLLVSGTEAYVNGEYLYQDYLYDDYGSDTDGQGALPLSARAGDVNYPTDTARYGNNAADIVEFRIKVSPTEVAYRLTLNTLLAADSTIIAIAFDTDGNALTGTATLPRDPSAPFPGTDEVIFIWGTGAEHVRFPLVGPPVTTPITDLTTDLEANQITIGVPRSVSSPSGTWKTIVATGCYDPVSGGWLLPQQNADATHPGGAGILDPAPAGIFNLAFRFNEFTPLGGNTKDVPPDSQQAVAIRNKTPQSYQHTIDFDALSAGAVSSTVPATGAQVRIFPSRLDLGEGKGTVTTNGSLSDPFPQYRGQLQSYVLHVPTTYTPGTPGGLVLMLHSLGEHQWQYLGATLVQQIGEDRGAFVATSESRGSNGWYQHSAETDVFEMWNDVAAHFDLDPDRTIVSGYSMGGYATYRLGTLYPDLFGSAFSQVGPPADGIWIPPGDPTGGAETLTNHWLENARNVPFLNVVGDADELVPLVGPRAQNLGAPEHGILGFDQLGYRFRFLIFANSDHLAQAAAGYNYPFAADFVGDGFVDRNPPHVTFASVPESDDVALGLVHDHAYWISDIVLADATPGASPPAKGVIDVLSHGFGLGDPASIAGATAGAVPPFTYSENNRTWGPTPAIAVANRADVRLTNIASARLDLARAALDPGATLTLPTTADGPALLTLDGGFPPGRVVYEDGVVLAGGTANAGGAIVPVNPGTHTYVIAPAPTCGVVAATGCRAPTAPRAAILQLRNVSPDAKDRLQWKWGRGAPTTLADFGDPLATTGYSLCVYDGLGVLVQAAAAPAGDVCNARHPRPCWRASRTGFRYVDRDLTPTGIRQIVLKSGVAGQAQIQVKGEGAALGLPSLPFGTLPLTVQLVNSDGACWQATYSSTLQNLGDRFKAKSD